MKTHFRRSFDLFRATSFWMLLCLTALAACKGGNSDVFPASPGFNEKDSDAKAIEIADNMMEKMGGFKAWQDARFVAWDFFGQYQIWDKKENLFRHEKGNVVCVMSLVNPQGQVFINGQRVLDSTQMMAKLSQAYTHWVYNEYFLALPYKLKENGVTLKYKGEGKTFEGRPADIIRVTFDSATVSPNNMHELYIDKETNMPVQWAFYGNRTDPQPSFIRKWTDFKDYNGVKLASNRDSQNDQLKITDIVVTDDVPKDLFLSAIPIDHSKVK